MRRPADAQGSNGSISGGRCDDPDVTPPYDPLADTNRTHVSELAVSTGRQDRVVISERGQDASVTGLREGEVPWSPVSSGSLVTSPIGRQTARQGQGAPDALDRHLSSHQKEARGAGATARGGSSIGSGMDREGLASRGTILEVDVTDGGMQYTVPGSGHTAGTDGGRQGRGSSLGLAAAGVLSGSGSSSGSGPGMAQLGPMDFGGSLGHPLHRRGLSDGLAFAGLHDSMMPAVGEELEEDELEASLSARGKQTGRRGRSRADGKSGDGRGTFGWAE